MPLSKRVMPLGKIKYVQHWGHWNSVLSFIFGSWCSYYTPTQRCCNHLVCLFSELVQQNFHHTFLRNYYLISTCISYLVSNSTLTTWNLWPLIGSIRCLQSFLFTNKSENFNMSESNNYRRFLQYYWTEWLQLDSDDL